MERVHRTVQKNLNEPDNHDGMVSHPEPDILEWEVRWALGSSTVHKAGGCKGISVELFKTLNDDAIEVLHSICQEIWQTQKWPQDWNPGHRKRSILIPISKGSTKECSNQWTIPLISSCLKSCMLGFSIMQTKNFQTSKQGLEKAEIKLSTFTGSYRKLGSFKKISTSVSPTMLKPLTVWIITNCGNLFQRWEYQTILPVFWETCM